MIKVTQEDFKTQFELQTIKMVRFLPNGVIKGYRLDTNTPITIKASKQVYTNYKRRYKATTFPAKAREVSILTFKGTVMNVELHSSLQGISEEFVAKMSSRDKLFFNTPDLKRNLRKMTRSSLLKKQDLFFDGVYLFFKTGINKVSLDEHVTIEEAACVNLMGLDAETLNFSQVSNYLKRDVITFTPAPGKEVYSPTITIADAKKKGKMNPFRLKKIVRDKDGGIVSDGNGKTKVENSNLLNGGAFVNLRFALAAAKTVGSMYGAEETRIFHIRKLMKELNQVNLYTLPKSVLALHPAGLNVKTALAFLFRFIDKETDIERLKRLRALFVNGFMTKGITFESVVKNIHKKGKGGSLPSEVLRTDDVSEQLARLIKLKGFTPEELVSTEEDEFELSA